MYNKVCTYFTFEWDENKNRSNKIKHGLSFEVAIQAFADPFALFELNGAFGGEDRYMAIGLLRGQLLISVIYSIVRIEGNYETYRVISARKASKSERKRHEEAADQGAECGN